jgi:hypothetical protein
MAGRCCRCLNAKRRLYAWPVAAYEESDDLKYEVVVSANEDVTNVHELWWAANTWWPDLPLSVRLRRAEDAILWALERDLIALYYDANAEGRRLAPHEWRDVLRDWRAWAVPEGRACSSGGRTLARNGCVGSRCRVRGGFARGKGASSRAASSTRTCPSAPLLSLASEWVVTARAARCSDSFSVGRRRDGSSRRALEPPCGAANC